MKKYIFILLIFISTYAKAQSNVGCYYDSVLSQILCGNMTIQGDPDNICDDGVHLWVQFTPNSSFNAALVQEALGSTDSYKVAQQIPAVYENQTTPISANIFTDDIWSQVIQLPFKFCFFDNKYTSIVIGANGQISFDTTLAGQINGYNTIGWPQLPFFNSSVNNAIFCPYHDILPTLGGTITYSVEGVAPCRKFIVSWNNIPMYDCINLTATQQIVLTEGSYRIDMNIINKPVCPTWLNGVAYMGLQNANATKAFTPPGYNGGPWTAYNESWSFIPNGGFNLSSSNTSNSITQGIYWVDSFSNNVIGFGDTLNYWPLTDTTIYVFFGDTTLLNDTCFLSGNDTCVNVCGKGYSCPTSNPYIRLHYYKPSANFTFNMTPNCIGADVQFNNLSTGSSSYYWDFGDGSTDTQPNPTHSYIGTGPYTAMLVAFGYGCSDTSYATIAPIIVPIQASFTLSNDSICGPTPITSTNTSIGNNLSYTWNMGDNTTYTTSNISHSYSSNGNYNVQLIIIDTITGCIDSVTHTVYVDDDRRARFKISPSNLCVGQKIYITDTINNNVTNFMYDFANGNTIFNSHNPIEQYDTAGDYSVTLFSNYPGCPAQTETHTIHVDNYPKVELGSPEEICTGRQTITIKDDNNPTATYLWSTNETTNSIIVSSPGNYEVKVKVGECESKDTKIITANLDCIFIPTAFSPNGDNKNDYFKPIWYDVNDVSSYRMIIYNRFGQQVYFTEDKFEKGWNGEFKNQPCSMDTYMYLISIVSQHGNKKTYKGDITLIK